MTAMTRKNFKKLLSQKILILDGATGTELVKRGMPAGVCPEKWILENPEAIRGVQGAYSNSGSDIVYVPSFGANRVKLAEFGLENSLETMNMQLAALSKSAVPGKLAFGDIAPTGKFISPFGDTSIDEAIDIFKEQASALVKGGVDGFAVETMMDIQEARAAVIAIREVSDLPVIVSMTFNSDGRTLTGNTAVSSLITLQALGIDAFGCNCSTGPADMLKVIKSLKPYATVPLFAKPNAGMPQLIDGKTVFGMKPDEFGSFMPAFAEAGVNLFGGCCGTTPDHIKAAADIAIKHKPLMPSRKYISAVSSARKVYFPSMSGPMTIIGERINPTGKKQLQAELREGKMNIVRQFATEQTANGADILDVNMGLSGIDEKAMILTAVHTVTHSSDLPLCIDTTNPDVMEAALRLYPGRALVNSITAEKDRIERMLPIAAKYGAMFVLLPVTDQGIPATLEERKEVVKDVFAKASKYGYGKDDVFVDALVMTISAEQSAAQLTLGLIDWCTSKFGVKTVCGLSNISFGMPERQWVNAAFLSMAALKGLSAAIANPSVETLMAAVAAADALTGKDVKLVRYVKKYSGASSVPQVKASATAALKPEELVYNCVLTGDVDKISDSVQKAVDQGMKASELVDSYLIPAINKVGELYDKKEYFLPQLIMSADAMRKGFEILQPLLESAGVEKDRSKRIILATVKGDIHDIGKNIVALMLRNYGFEVIDLGKDVPADIIIGEAVKNGVCLIGLSALMTTTMMEMKTVVDYARSNGHDKLKFIIGGAVVDKNFADQIGAHGFAKDAMEAVTLAESLVK